MKRPGDTKVPPRGGRAAARQRLFVEQRYGTKAAAETNRSTRTKAKGRSKKKKAR